MLPARTRYDLLLADAELRAVERQWGVQFPDDYRTFSTSLDAG